MVAYFFLISENVLFLQGSAWGHDSFEDARASVELILWKTRKDLEKSRISSKI
jgi:hypothetical protein